MKSERPFIAKIGVGPFRYAIKRLAQTLGIERQLYELYSKLYIFWTQGTITLTVADTAAKYRISTKQEVSFFESLGGERAVFEDLLPRLQEDDIFLDVGAHIGLYSCLIGSRLKNGKVISIEPHPKNVDCLQRNLSINGIDGTVIEAAASDERGKMTFDIDPTSNMLLQSKKTVPVQVDAIVIDELLESSTIPLPSIIKIDVDGGELNAMQGMRTTLESARIVYCEVHPKFLQENGQSDDEVYRFLRNSGFQLTEIMTEMGTDQKVTTVRAER